MLRRGPVGRRGPGLIGMAARTAVVAGTATAVSGAVHNKQMNKQEAKQAAAQQAAQQADQQQAAAAAPAPEVPAPSMDEKFAALEKLASLRTAGVLTEEEFAAEKAKILAS